MIIYQTKDYHSNKATLDLDKADSILEILNTHVKSFNYLDTARNKRVHLFEHYVLDAS